MTSAGGLVHTHHFKSKESILSGPAGGVVACAHFAKDAGFEKAIGLDMGGTSTDVSRYDGQRLLVGPESSGANPGPACYGHGGDLTLTDINLYNGKIHKDFFPFLLDEAIVKSKLKNLSQRIEEESKQKYTLPQLAEGFTKIANLKMATAINTTTVLSK